MAQKESISLEQFKQAMASEATRKAERLEERNKELKELNRKMGAEINRRREICRIMFNRCYALTQATTCFMCGFRETCDEERSVMKGGRQDGK